jgi:ABC-type antimicrobial peptide transport system permease subunit
MLAWGLILFIGLIGVLNIINTVYTNIHTRIAEIGTQRAVGMSAGSLYRTFLWEGAYYGIIAAVIGCIAGYGCTVLVEAAAAEELLDELRLVFPPLLPMAEAVVLSIAACLLATAVPLRKIAKLSIVDSIETVE